MSDPRELIVAEQALGLFNIHLVSGENIIGRVSTKDDPQTGARSYVVVKPMVPNIRQGMKRGNDGQPEPVYQMGLLGLLPYLDVPEVEIFNVYVMWAVPIPEQDQLFRAYIAATSGIEIADASQVKLT